MRDQFIFYSDKRLDKTAEIYVLNKGMDKISGFNSKYNVALMTVFRVTLKFTN